MGTINILSFIIDGGHGMLPLPKKTVSALNGISSEPGLLKIPCGPWHLGRAKAWAGLRADMVFWGGGRMPWAPSMVKICILMLCHAIFSGASDI